MADQPGHGYTIKLVRDRITDLGEVGDHIAYESVEDRDEHRDLLHRKLGEEVTEYLLDPGDDELADVLAVVQALASLDGLPQRIWMRARNKAADRGGFMHGLKMVARYPNGDTDADPPRGAP
jgi:predicted house-cleaning noncanonical NTP pyrophosphatase (MazG superfamily)